MNGRRRPLFLILDSLPTHRAKIVSDYVASRNGKLQFFFLPGYAPTRDSWVATVRAVMTQASGKPRWARRERRHPRRPANR
jgi:hypothetical protein